MSLNKVITLAGNPDLALPAIGLGTWQSEPGEVYTSVKTAVQSGYRHLDLAQVYGNQTEVGQALAELFKDGVVTRKDLWITSKLWNVSHAPSEVEKELDYTLKQLGIDYLDLYLIHWPVAFEPTETPADPKAKKNLFPLQGDRTVLDLNTSLADTWNALRKARDTGKTRAIGVSNFSIEHLEGIHKASGEWPAVNQVEAHPKLPQNDLIAFGKKNGIHLTAYSPLGNNSRGLPLLTEDELIKKIASEITSKTGKEATTGQVLIAWGIKHGFSEIPKSVQEHRIKGNFQQVELDDAQYNEINKKFGQSPDRFNVPVEYKPQWFINVFSTPKEDVSGIAQVKIQ